MISLLLELEVLGRQLKYSRTGRSDSVGSTSTLRLGCFGRTHAILPRFRKSKESLLMFYIANGKARRIWGIRWSEMTAACFDDGCFRSHV